MTEPGDSAREHAAGIDRRKAIKWGVGVTAGAVVWTEPYVVGLARRPSYAAAASVITTTGSLPVNLTDPTLPVIVSDGTVDIEIVETASGYTFTVVAGPAGETCSVTGGSIYINGTMRAPDTFPVVPDPDADPTTGPDIGIIDLGGSTYGREFEMTGNVTYSCCA